ncbi:MAG: cation transporter, partial [Bdellovibrionales bacterium]|nr:cation transporter [Bdellovibrionales bacterium]
LSAFAEVVRRFLFGGDPSPLMMIGVSSVALIANVSCLLLLMKHRHGAIHMKASWIFSTNDVLANAGVIIAGILVYVFKTPWPDLIIGAIIAVIVARGALSILRISLDEKVID